MDCELSADIYYSFEAEGFFAEFSLGRELKVSENFSVTVAGLFGMNQGYVSDGHDGANNLAIRMEGNLALSEAWSVVSHVTYSSAMDADASLVGDAQLIDFYHGGVGLLWTF
jgi:hypothetical protein